MTVSKTLLTSSIVGVITVAFFLAIAQQGTTPTLQTGYAAVNGLNLYYEFAAPENP